MDSRKEPKETSLEINSQNRALQADRRSARHDGITTTLWNRYRRRDRNPKWISADGFGVSSSTRSSNGVCPFP